MTVVIYWDIDGTLLSTARAGVPALEDGAERVLGARPDLSQMITSGLTDRMIARRILEQHGEGPDVATERLLLDAYGEALPARLLEKRGSVLPGVSESLDECARLNNVRNVLLTGNIRVGAKAKLQAYGLDHHFDLGAFAEDGYERGEIARVAVARAHEQYGSAALTGVLIGDTTYDCQAGAEVGLRVVAVASAPGSRADLEACRPWWVVDQVPAAGELLQRLQDRVTS